MGSESEPNFGLVFHSRSDARPCSWTLRGEALREGVRYQSYLPSDPSTFASASSPWALPLCQNVPGRKPQDKPPCGFPSGSATTQSKEQGRASHFGLSHKHPSSTPQCAVQPLGKPLGLILCTSPARTVSVSLAFALSIRIIGLSVSRVPRQHARGTRAFFGQWAPWLCRS